MPAAPGPLAPGDSDTLMVTLDTSMLGARVADVIIAGDDPSNPADTLVASGNTLNHAQPSIESIQLTSSTSLFLGSLSQGSFTDSTVSIYNYLYGPSQAQLEAYSFNISGADSAYFSLVGFAPQTIAATPGSVTVHFDDASVTQARPYFGTLVVHHRDDQALPGATNLSDLTWSLVAVVTDLATDAAPQVAHNRLQGNVPNPFNPATTIVYELATATRVQLVVFDSRGRLVRTLLAGPRSAGPHRVVWDGRDDRGRPVSSGVYFTRMRTRDFEQTRRMTLLR
jgi:hypothetical protein